MKTEPDRVRTNGTKVTNAKSAAEILAALREVLASGYSKINGLTVDTTTASMVVNVTDKMRPEARSRWFAKIDGYYADGKDPRVILYFWIDTFWKAIKA